MKTQPEGFLAQAGKGRPKGAQNKTTKLAKQAIAEAFDKLGGMDALVAWAKSEPDNMKVFYATIWPKIIPLDVNNNVEFVDRTEQLQRAREEVRNIFGERPDLGSGDHGRGLPH